MGITQLVKKASNNYFGLFGSVILAISLLLGPTALAATQQSGSIGVQGAVRGAAPNSAPTIDIPSNGQGFNSATIRVSGLCQNGLLVEIYKNNVFAGSVECSGGSYSLQIDLFNGRNDLIARQYDALDQASPDSNAVSVNLNTAFAGNGPQVVITTQYAKRGADPGAVLTWPLTISGGTPPYAISIDWGDKTAFELISLAKPGDFNMTHTYNAAGIYNVTVKASDSQGNTAFLQLVGIGNGPITQSQSTNQKIIVQRIVVWWPFIVLIALAIVAFWLGRKHQLDSIRGRIRRGERPF